MSALQGPPFRTTNFIKSVGQLFFEVAVKNPDRVCQIDPETNVQETFGSVRRRSVRVAIALKKRGLTSKDVVVICSGNTMDSIVPVLATFYLGAKVASLDPKLSPRHTQHLLSVVSPTMIFVEKSSLGLMEDSLKKLEISPKIFVFGLCGGYEKFDDLLVSNFNEKSFLPANVDMQDTSVMFFSSGTTGLPKAICHTHFSLIHMIEASHDYFSGALLLFNTFYSITSVVFTFATFSNGFPKVIVNRSISPEGTMKIVEKYKVGTMYMAPILTYQLTRYETPKHDLSSVKSLVTTGTPISSQQIERLQRMFKKATISFGYGMSEIGTIALNHFGSPKPGSCGRLTEGIELKVVHVQTGEKLGANEEGDICVKSQCLMKGYHKMKASNSCFDSEGFLQTGDIGYYDEEEYVYIVGRAKETFKYLSWPIVPSAIEHVLLEHPSVKDAVVFGLPAPKEEEGEVPAACVELNEGFDVEEKELENFVERHVEDVEKLRGGITIVESLPKTPTNKVMRREVRDSVVKRNFKLH